MLVSPLLTRRDPGPRITSQFTDIGNSIMQKSKTLSHINDHYTKFLILFYVNDTSVSITQIPDPISLCAIPGSISPDIDVSIV